MSTPGFGEQLRLARTAAGLSQRAFAVAAGMSLATVRDLEQGRSSRPRERSVESVIAALGLAGSAAEALRRASAAPGVVGRRAGEEAHGPLRVEVLGHLVVRRGSARLHVGSTKRQMILGRLALSANVPVPADELVDLLWGREAPASARNMLQVQVSRLRAVLAGDGRWTDSAEPLPRTGPGYALVLTDDGLDLSVFRRLVHGAAKAGSPERAAEALESALLLCRGDVLADGGQKALMYKSEDLAVGGSTIPELRRRPCAWSPLHHVAPLRSSIGRSRQA
jgi:transcriptional regulator with XRE-family HTH domain